MSDKQKQLENRIRALTKQIGIARREHQREELSNLRAHRNGFARQLAEEFDTYFIIENEGTTRFVSQEEMMEHYEDPEHRNKIRGAGIVSQLYEQRQWCKEKVDWVASASAEEIKEYLENTLQKRLKGVQEAIHEIQDEIGEEPLDFELIDARTRENAELLEGIDFSSLMDNHGDNKQEKSKEED